MKIQLILAAITHFTVHVVAHEAVTIGPHGGRVLYVDSPVTPNVELLVNSEGKAEICLLDKHREPIVDGSQSISVTVGPRSEAKKLAVTKQGPKFVTEALPHRDPYLIVVQLRESAEAKAITLRLNYDTTPSNGKPKYLDDSPNLTSGDNIEVPTTAAGIWAELNQHQLEITEAVPEKEYEAIDEITRAFPKLARGLPAQSGDKREAAQALVDQLVKHLASVREASAARKLEKTKADMEGIAASLAELKKLYPADVANAKLAE
jgi:hypothetical protein